MLNKLTRAGIAAACLTLGLPLIATPAAADVQQGRDYTLLARQQPADSKDKIEVIEFFWYGCGHCYHFEPVISAWARTLPKDVVFRQVPADFGRWTGGAKLYYALQAIGEESRVRRELFDAIHQQRLNFNNVNAVADWLGNKGVDKQKFLAAYNSFSVQSQVTRAQQLTAAHGLNGVPAVVVGGKYLLNNAAANGLDGLPPVINQLVAKVRSEQATK